MREILVRIRSGRTEGNQEWVRSRLRIRNGLEYDSGPCRSCRECAVAAKLVSLWRCPADGFGAGLQSTSLDTNASLVMGRVWRVPKSFARDSSRSRTDIRDRVCRQ